MQYGKARIAVVNKDGQQIGWKLRRHIDKKRDLVRTATIILFNQDDEILLTRSRGSIWPNKWSSSCAGLIRDGESLQEAAHRTLLRELRLEVPVRLLAERYRDFQGVKRLHAVFTGRTREEIEVSRRDAMEARWVSPGEAAKIISRGLASPTLQGAFETLRSWRNASRALRRTW